MSEAQQYPKRLIEVDLPIRKISEQARREKSIRHGHISTLHLWWARRPLAACRAVILAALWPDPADSLCPPRFQTEAATQLRTLRDRIGGKQRDWNEPLELREGLLDFIAAFSDWDRSTDENFLAVCRNLTRVAHESLGGEPGSRPLVLDPFAGGGAIPLEALRVGADAFASDLNPVAVLLNKTVLEYVPRFREELIEKLRLAAERVHVAAEEELSSFYPRDADGAIPLTYLWARTIQCEGPGCGASVPLLRSLWLAKRRGASVALECVPDKKRKKLDFRIVTGVKASAVGHGTSSGGAATCPVCDYTTPVESVRMQLGAQEGGAATSRLIAVVTTRPDVRGQSFRSPTAADERAVRAAVEELDKRRAKEDKELPLVPDGEINHLRGFFNVVLYGNTRWGHLFSPRQLLTLTTLARLIRELPDADISISNVELSTAVRTCLALMLDRVAVRCTANCIWDCTTGCIMQIFNQGQSLPARWEFAEMSPLLDSGSGWSTSLEYSIKVLEHCLCLPRAGTAQRALATSHPLPDDSASVIFTDPPYYAAVPYADLSDFFYSWLRRSLITVQGDLLRSPLVEKTEELVSLAHRAAMYRNKDNAWFENRMKAACVEARRTCVPWGVAVFVFANKETSAWEAMLGALISSGWTVTASWAIDTESGNRLRAKDSAALGSSIHLVCRPRDDTASSVQAATGDWRDVLGELPKRMHEWIPRLAHEGIVGSDAIFACLGPALEVFSRYSRVEKASGEEVKLKDYLECVWAAVANEALSLIFAGGDASGFEEDARLTAMWLWTLSVGQAAAAPSTEESEDEDDDGDSPKKAKLPGFLLEFDAARKIAQGLGAHLEELGSLVQAKGETARLLPVAERAKALFGKADKVTQGKKPKRETQGKLPFAKEKSDSADTFGIDIEGEIQAGSTVLDRLHQAMILFGAGRSEALRRFVVDEGVGQDDRFWRLGQALSALYPPKSEEKRWVDGVLARKKGLGF